MSTVTRHSIQHDQWPPPDTDSMYRHAFGPPSPLTLLQMTLCTYTHSHHFTYTGKTLCLSCSRLIRISFTTTATIIAFDVRLTDRFMMGVFSRLGQAGSGPPISITKNLDFCCKIFTGWIPCLWPTHQCQSTEGLWLSFATSPEVSCITSREHPKYAVSQNMFTT